MTDTATDPLQELLVDTAKVPATVSLGEAFGQKGRVPQNTAADASPPLPALTCPNLVKAIAAVMREVDTVAKAGENTFHHYRYAKMEDILKVLTPLLGRHGIVVFQSESSRAMFDNDRVIAITYSFTVAHETGEIWPERLQQTGVSRCRDSKGGWDDKCANKAHTAARKYFLLGLFQIPTGDEADADKGDNETRHEVQQTTRIDFTTPHRIIGGKPVQWAANFTAAVRHATTSAMIDEWVKLNKEPIGLLANHYPTQHAEVKAVVTAMRKALEKGDEPPDLDDSKWETPHGSN
jgi:ERF superfamily